MSEWSLRRLGARALVCACALAFRVEARADGGAAATAESSSTASSDATPTPTATAFSTSIDAPAPEGEPVELPEQVVRLPGARPSDPTSSATVVSADRFAGEAKGVAELVATAPGVAVRDQGGLGQLATVSIRGASADGVRVLLDGLPLNTGAGGGVDLARIPRHWISSVEIVRGAEGARWGAGALGGVVNLVTRPAGSGRWSAEAGGGSFGTFTAGADASAGGARAGLVAALSASGTDGAFPYHHDPEPLVDGPLVPLARRHNAARAGGLLVKGFSLRGAARWDALVQLSGGDRQLPGNAYVQSTEADQRDARAALVLRHARPAPWRGLFSATVSARADGLDHESAAAAIRQRGQGGSLRLEASAPLGPASLDAGVSAGGERLEATGLADDARARAEGAAWAAVDVPALGGRLRLAPAVRAEAVGPFRGISAKLGASAAIVGPLSLRASAGRTFRPPSFSELHLTQGLLRPNPDLDPERGTSADVTLAAEGALGLAAVGAFASVYDDLVVYVPVFRAFRPENDDRALVRGIEAEAATVPLGPFRVQAQGALTLQETRTLRGRPEEVGNDVPRRPRARAFARVGAERGWVALHAELHHTGRQALDTRGIQWIDAATSVNAGGSVRLARRANVRAHLEVRNLGDDRTLEDGFGNPLPGRMVMVTLRADGATR